MEKLVWSESGGIFKAGEKAFKRIHEGRHQRDRYCRHDTDLLGRYECARLDSFEMSQFVEALQYALYFEDRNRTYAENVDNNGGRVIAGINSKSFPQDEAAIAALPQSQRAAALSFFYYSKFWTLYRVGGLGRSDVANRYFDCSVDCWIPEAIEMLKRAINALHAGTIEVDGAIGPITLAAANSADPEALLAAYREQRVAYYEAIAAKNPADKPDLAGWLVRARS